MSLDETSLAIGRLQAAQESTTDAIAKVEDQMGNMNTKLDKILAQNMKHRLSIKSWVTLITASSAGAGGVAHALTKFFGP